MLVLSRKLGESILIGDNIVVKVVGIDNGLIKLGIDAPRDVTIVRNELIEKVKEQNKAALHTADIDELDELSKLLKK